MLSRIYAIAAVVGVLVSAAAARAQELTIMRSKTTGLPVVYAYHGMLLNYDLSVISPTNDNKSKVFRAYTRALLDIVADPAARDEFPSLAKNARVALQSAPSSTHLADAAINYWLLERVPVDRRQRFNGALRAVEAWAGIKSSQDTRLDILSKASLTRYLMNDKRAPTDVPFTAGEDYIKACQEGGVPIPADWGSSEWQKQGELESKYTFAGNPTNITQVWTYTSKATPGVCVALPRRDQATKSITLLGIICQSENTGKACFWDNIDRATGLRLEGPAGEAFKITNVQNANDLGENCTNCHRGYNVFLIHPGTGIDIRAMVPTDPLSRYIPISIQKTWGNPGPLLDGQKPCAGCHEVPALRDNNDTDATMPSSYCRILEKVVNTTMPNLKAPAGWKTPDPKFAAHVTFLRGRCSGELEVVNLN